jgi:hypothetical protein
MLPGIDILFLLATVMEYVSQYSIMRAGEDTLRDKPATVVSFLLPSLGPNQTMLPLRPKGHARDQNVLPTNIQKKTIKEKKSCWLLP